MAQFRPVSLPRAIAAAAITSAALAAVAPAAASAATTIGANLSTAPKHMNTCDGPTPGSTTSCDLAPLTEGNVAQTAPSSGVVTRWRVVGGSGPMKLRVLRPQSDGSFLFVSSSAVESPSNTGLVTFNTQLPVQAGDYIGIELESATATLGVDNNSQAPVGTSAMAFAGPVADGGLEKPAEIAQQARGYVNADIEPDADHDGYGDETQDQCPTNAATQGPCPPPPPVVSPRKPALLTTFGHFAHLSRSGGVSFYLRSNERVSGAVTATLSLPKTAKVLRFARHTVRLKAGVKTKVTLRLSKKNAAQVRRALKAHRHLRLTAKVTIRLKDSAGTVATKVLRLRIR